MSEIKVKTIEPSTGTNLTLGTSGDTVAVSSDAVKLDIWKDSGGNTLFQSDGAGTLSNVNSGLSGAGPKLILSQTASTSTSVDFTSGIDSTYDHYMFVFTEINPDTNNASFQFQANASGQSGFNETITSTWYQAKNTESDTDGQLYYDAAYDQQQGTDWQFLNLGTGAEADECCCGIMHLFNPSSTTYVKQWYSRMQTYHNANQTFDSFAAGYINVTAAITQISFRVAFDAFDGKIKMYGVA